MQNPNCDGSGPCAMGEVRVLPWTRDVHGGNSILCRNCYHHEISFRQKRNRELAEDCRYDLPTWDSLKVYGEESLWDAIKSAGIQYSNHNSDLYLPDRPQVRAILERFPVHKSNARRFKHQPDGAAWIDVPFAYLPWWQARDDRGQEGA